MKMEQSKSSLVNQVKTLESRVLAEVSQLEVKLPNSSKQL